MPSYTNESCPVCRKKFTADDDIVICPVCGTPHHRECYSSLGHCANVQKHGTAFSYTPSAKGDEQTVQNNQSRINPNNVYYTPDTDKSADNGNEKKRCVRCNAEIDKDAQFCSHCGQRQTPDFGENRAQPDFGSMFGAQFSTGYENSADKIDDKSVADAADVVRTNTRRFIPKFIENKKISWNWGALFFGPYYLFFRKMYSQGIIAMAVRLIISLIAQGLYAEPFAAFSRFVMSNYNSLTNNPTDEALINRMTELSNELVPMFAIIIGANVLLHLILALFADRFYRQKVISILNKVDQKLEAGKMFEQGFMFDANDISLSQDDMKKLYLNKLGGTSLFSPLMAFFIYDIITSIISSL